MLCALDLRSVLKKQINVFVQCPQDGWKIRVSHSTLHRMDHCGYALLVLGFPPWCYFS
jgi:hypothetical protein